MQKQIVAINSKEFQPKNEYILVKPAEMETEKVTAGGLIIPINPSGSVNARPTSGDVIAVGADIKDIKKGSFIIWPETDGLDIEFNDGAFILLRYKSVIGSKK